MASGVKGAESMRTWTYSGAIATTLVALFACASSAFADSGVWAAAAEAPLSRVALGVVSVVFTAALARSHT